MKNIHIHKNQTEYHSYGTKLQKRAALKRVCRNYNLSCESYWNSNCSRSIILGRFSSTAEHSIFNIYISSHLSWLPDHVNVLGFITSCTSNVSIPCISQSNQNLCNVLSANSLWYIISYQYRWECGYLWWINVSTSSIFGQNPCQVYFYPNVLCVTFSATYHCTISYFINYGRNVYISSSP